MRQLLLLLLLFAAPLSAQTAPNPGCTFAFIAPKVGVLKDSTQWTATKVITLYGIDGIRVRATCPVSLPVDSSAFKVVQKQLADTSVVLATTRTTLTSVSAALGKALDSLAKLTGGCTGCNPPPDTTPPPPPPPPPPSGANSLYFNSAEAGCGADANVIWCDDFEDGDWYTKNCDQANASGGLTQTDGWCGTIYANAYIPQAVQCNGGAAGTRCAAYSGTLPGPNPDNTGNMGDHNLSGGTHSELWFRWYVKYSAGHSMNPQKTLTVNSTQAGDGGISIGGFGFGGGSWSMCPVSDCNGSRNNVQNTGCPWGNNYYLCQNQGANLAFSSVLGKWVYMELHLKMNTSGQSNGVYELWMNDCGTTGVCTGSPTLRARFTNVQWTSNGAPIRSFWVENQSPPDGKTSGQEWYDQIKVSRAGPVGFVR